MTRASLTIATLVLTCAPAGARPGFYVEVSAGLHGVSGDDVPLSSLQPADNGATITQAPPLSTDYGNGPALALRFGYNIMGYAALELGIGGGGAELGDSALRAAAGHVSLVARGYPLQHWFSDLPIEPWLLVGGGYSIQYQPLIDHIAWDGGALHLGLGLDYYPYPWLSLSAELRYARVFCDTFYFDYNDNEVFPVDPKVITNYFVPAVTVGFHFLAAN